MRAVLSVVGVVLLASCGGGGVTGTNYSEDPPVAEILARPSATPTLAVETSADVETVPASDSLAVEATGAETANAVEGTEGTAEAVSEQD